MIEIPGGTKTIVSNSLLLSSLFLKPIRLVDINKQEKTKGLDYETMLLANVLSSLTKAEVKNLKPKTNSFSFFPSTFKANILRIKPKSFFNLPYFFSKLLPLSAKMSFSISSQGSTHLPNISFDYLQYCLVPFLQKRGLLARASVSKINFFPKTKGLAKLEVKKSNLKPIKIEEKGELDHFQILISSRGFDTVSSIFEKTAKAELKKHFGKDIGMDIQKKNIELKEEKGASFSIVAHYSNLPFFISKNFNKTTSAEKIVKQAIKELISKIKEPFDPLFLEPFFMHCLMCSKKSFFPIISSKNLPLLIDLSSLFSQKEIQITDSKLFFN